MTTTLNRREQGPVKSPTGTPARGAQAQRAGDSLKPKTTLFRMIGQTVCIHCPREEWSELKGRYATVVNQWGDGSVCVEVQRWHGGNKMRIQFARHEIEHVPLNDYIRHHADEECALISRAVELAGYGYRPVNGMVADRVMVTLARRAEGLKVRIRAIQRLKLHALLNAARSAKHGLGNYCTAMVPYTGGVA